MAIAEITNRYRAESLRKFTASLFIAAGMDADKAAVVAEVLVMGDMVAAANDAGDHALRADAFAGLPDGLRYQPRPGQISAVPDKQAVAVADH